MAEKRKVKAHVSEKKKKRVAELSNFIKNKKTVLVASIKNIPGNQFQEIVKKLRGNAVVTVPKKSLIFRAIDGVSNEEQKEIEKLKEKITESIAVLFSDLDVFELSSELIQSKRFAKAKPGQIAPEDIKIPKGPTDLMPGPAISELGDLGIPIQIEKGKIHIKQSKVIVKKGEEISKKAADVMSKLNIKPFLIGFIPLCAFDNEEKKFYSEINIDPEQTLEDLKTAFSKALPFAVEIGYVSEDTITFMLRKAGTHEKALSSLTEKSEDEKNENEEKSEEKKEDEASKTEEKEKEEPEKKEDGTEKKDKEETQQENKSQEENK